MILESAVLDVRPGRCAEFERAFVRARSIISAAAGFRGLELQRCIGTRGRYLLLVRWENLSDHTEGFRGSAAYREWKELLHPFYDPFPTVEHYEPVDSAEPA